MENMSYEKTFEFAKAYAELGIKERKIMEYLFELVGFEGSYSALAKEVNMEVSNVRNALKYLEALGIVCIGYKKYLDEIKFYQRKNGKIVASHNSMKYCYIVAGWIDTLIKQYQNGNIFHDESKKKLFVEKMTELLYKDMELEYKNCKESTENAI